MRLANILFGALMIILGLSLLFNPGIIFGWFENNLGSDFLYPMAIVIRAGLGILFILSAKKSKFPGVIKLLGYLFLVAAGTLILLGKANFLHFIETVFSELFQYAAIVGVITIAFGGFIISAFIKGTK